MKTIVRNLNDYKTEAEVNIDILFAEGHGIEGIYEIAKIMVKQLEPVVLKRKAKLDQDKLLNNLK